MADEMSQNYAIPYRAAVGTSPHRVSGSTARKAYNPEPMTPASRQSASCSSVLPEQQGSTAKRPTKSSTARKAYNPPAEPVRSFAGKSTEPVITAIERVPESPVASHEPHVAVSVGQDATKRPPRENNAFSASSSEPSASSRTFANKASANEAGKTRAGERRANPIEAIEESRAVRELAGHLGSAGKRFMGCVDAVGDIAKRSGVIQFQRGMNGAIGAGANAIAESSLAQALIERNNESQASDAERRRVEKLTGKGYDEFVKELNENLAKKKPKEEPATAGASVDNKKPGGGGASSKPRPSGQNRPNTGSPRPRPQGGSRPKPRK